MALSWRLHGLPCVGSNERSVLHSTSLPPGAQARPPCRVPVRHGSAYGPMSAGEGLALVPWRPVWLSAGAPLASKNLSHRPQMPGLAVASALALRWKASN